MNFIKELKKKKKKKKKKTLSFATLIGTLRVNFVPGSMDHVIKKSVKLFVRKLVFRVRTDPLWECNGSVIECLARD